MARLVIAAAGAAVGFSIGGLTGAQIGWSIGGVLGAAFGPKQRTYGPRLDDTRITGVDLGTVIPYLEGSPRARGSVAYASQIRTIETTTSQGKGGGGAEYTSYTNEVDVLYVLSENIGPGVSRVFINGDLMYDGATLRDGVWDDIRFYTGDDSQAPDPTYEADVGTANALAFTRRQTVFIQGLKLGTGGQLPNITFERGEPGVTDQTTYLLSNFAAGSTEDVSVYAHGGAVVTNSVILSDGNLRLDYSLTNSPTAEFYDPDYAVTLAMPCVTYEWLFTPTHIGFPGAAAIIVILSCGGQDWNVTYTGDSHLQIIPSTGGTGAPSFYTSNPTTITSNPCHLAFQVYNDNTVSIYFSGNLIKNRVTSNVTYPASGATGFLLGGLRSGFLTETFIDFTDVRITRSEVYTGSTYDQPTSLELISNATPGSPVTAPVSDVVSRLMLRAGYSASEFDTSGLASITRPVRGLALTQIASTSNAIDILAAAYFFEYYGTDKIYFNPRGGEAVATIPYDDLRVDPSPDADAEPFPLVYGNELEAPARIFLTYANMSADYQRGVEQSDRLISGQQSDNQIELPLGLLPDEAKGIAESTLLDLIAELPTATISLGIEYSFLRPTHVVNVTDHHGNVRRMRVVTRKDAGGVFTLDLVGDDSTVFIPIGGTDNNYVPQSVKTIAATEWVLIDGPIARDEDDTPGYYVAAKPGPGDLWPGAVLLESFDGANYSQSALITAKAVFGVCTSTLPNFAGGFVFDETSTLTVDVGSGELASSTRAALLDDQAVNAAAVGSPENGWELLQFRTATMSAPGVYTLSGFLRGRKGTEQFVGTHGAAEYFVLLDAATIRRTTGITSEIGLARSVKVVTTNLALASVTAETFTNTGVGLKPYAPANPTALKSGSALTITAQRRTRLQARYGGTPGTSVPLGEASEAYRIRVYSGSTLKRTINATSLPYTYAAASIAADGFASGNAITFTIAQVSQAVGDGYLSTFTGIAP